MPKTKLSGGWPRLLLLSALALLIASALQPAAVLAASDWANATKLSQRDGEGSYEPAIAVDQEGFVHAAWHSGTTADKWRVFYTNNRSGRFFTPRRISEDSGEHKDVDIAVTNDGHVHVIATRRLDFLSEVVYFESPDYGQTWPLDDPNDAYRIRNISNSDKNGVEGAIASDAQNNLYFVWADNRTGDYRIWYTVRVGGVFGETDEVSRGTQTRHVSPDVVVTSNGGASLVHVAFNSRPARGNDADDRVFYSLGTLVPTDLSRGRYGIGFNPARQMTGGEKNTSQNPALATDGVAKVFLAYEYVDFDDRDRRDRNIYLQYSNNAGASWSGPGLVSRAPNALSSFSAIAYGRASGRQVVTIAWQESVDPNPPRVYAIEYFPDTNQFDAGGQALISGSVREGSRVAVAGYPTVDIVAANFQALDGTANRKVYYTSRAVGLSATPSLNGGAAFTNNPNLSVALEKQGLPSKLRYAVDRDPSAGDPVIDFPASNSFNVLVPPSAQCTRSVAIQVSGDGVNFTAPTRDSIIVDTAVQATVAAVNPGAGDPGYTRTPQARLNVRPDGECTSLTGSTPSLGTDGAGGFSGIVSLANGPNGPREVSIVVNDQAGNVLTATQTITVDTVAPNFITGTLSAPNDPLPTVMADLRLSGVEVTDNFFPGGLWGVEIANTLSPTDTNDTLVWTPRQVLREADGAIIVRDWTVATNLGLPIGDPSLAGRPIQVRVRFLDGAGNFSTQPPLSASVTLASGYSATQANLPLIVKQSSSSRAQR